MLLKDLRGLAPLEKNTEGDKRNHLYQAVNSYMDKEGSYYYGYLEDYDDQYIYFGMYKRDTERYHYWKVAYQYNEGVVTLAEEVTEVSRMTEWKDLPKTVEKSLTERIAEGIEKYFGGSKAPQAQLIEKFNEEKMEAIEPLYIAIGSVDGVGDAYASPEVCYEMVKSFNQAITDGKLSGNYFHAYNTDDFTVQKAWITECDCVIGNTEVKEGQPLVKVKFNNEKAWELRKSGELTGVSIGAIAEWEEVDEN